jgi:hypothetical protein
MRCLLAAAVVAGCFDAPMTMGELPCPPEGTELRYDTFGRGFFASYCDRCHTSATNGAPASFQFDTIDKIRSHRERIFIRAAGPNTTMPPGRSDPPEVDRDQLAEWLTCGAP